MYRRDRRIFRSPHRCSRGACRARLFFPSSHRPYRGHFTTVAFAGAKPGSVPTIASADDLEIVARFVVTFGAVVREMLAPVAASRPLKVTFCTRTGWSPI